MALGGGGQTRSVVGRAACAMLVAALVPRVAPATAQSPRRATLAYDRRAGASRCPDDVTLRELVAARLGYEPFVAEAGLAVSVVMDGEGGQLRAQIEVHDAPSSRRGRRSLASTDSTCRELVESVALAIALAIDPRATTASRPSAVTPAPPPTSPVEPVRSAPAPVVSTPARPRGTRDSASRSARRPNADGDATPLAVHVGAGGLVALGTEPDVTVGALVLVGLVGARLSAWLEGRTDLASSRVARDGSGVEASLTAASLFGCYRLGPVELCGLGSLGVLSGRGRGIAVPRDDTSLHAALGTRAMVSVRVVGPLELRAFADLAFPLTPTTLRIDTQERWSTPVLAGAIGASAAMVIVP
ncbi:MAG: hypothetical protein IT379_16095 [Deltaproteobacteria bacterium]|nr:hypothetical protein [Deltaproteobacteria bacterium]